MMFLTAAVIRFVWRPIRMRLSGFKQIPAIASACPLPHILDKGAYSFRVSDGFENFVRRSSYSAVFASFQRASISSSVLA